MRMRRKIYSGAVLEQIVYPVSDRAGSGSRKPQLRFRSDEERAAHRLGISRRRFARLINANCTPDWNYGTLTFDAAHELHDFGEARRVAANFRRRLQRAFNGLHMFLVMGRGKTAHRIHFHIVTDCPADILRRAWVYGNVERCDPLRKHNYFGLGADRRDMGRDYTGLANYLFDHWTPEQGGHRWMQTRNMAQPEAEEAQPVTWHFSERRPPAAPKGYALVEIISTHYGFYSFKYVRVDSMAHARRKDLRNTPYAIYDGFAADGRPRIAG